ncbi:unnamed protein product [Amaranthus hypochondriacus]
MASNSKINTITMKLKLMVDVKANKVVFAEAGKDFVDFIFHLMTLPLAAISKLLHNQAMVSCNVVNLFKCIDALHTDCFQPNLTKTSLLSPKTAITVPFFSFFDVPTAILPVYACSPNFYSLCNNVTDCAGTICPNCDGTMNKVAWSDFKYVTPTASNMLDYTTTKYVRGGALFVVTDKMEVKPMSISFVMSLGYDLDNLEEQQVQVGPQQALAILKAVLENRDVLTSVFLLQKNAKRKHI